MGLYFFCCEEDSKGSFKSERWVTLYTLIKFLASSIHHHSSFIFHSVTENILVAKLSWCGEQHTPNICYYFLIPWLPLYVKNMKNKLLNSADDFQDMSMIQNLNQCLDNFIYKNS